MKSEQGINRHDHFKNYSVLENYVFKTRCTTQCKIQIVPRISKSITVLKGGRRGAEIQPSQRDLEHQAIFLEDETLCHDATACNYECLCTAKFEWRFYVPAT